MLPPGLRDLANPAKVMAKEYDYACPVCLVPDTPEWPEVVHCGSCHETFGDSDLWVLHRSNRGCRFPGNLERFYETHIVIDLYIWLQKPDPNEERK